MEALELALQRGPGSKHCIDYSLEDRVAIDQLTDARVEPTAADGTNLQAEAAEHAADAALDVEQLGLDQLARSEGERTSCALTDFACTGRYQPSRSSWAMPRASRRSVFTVIADNAAFTCRVSSSTASKPALVRPA